MKPLSGLRVLDLTRVMAGPFCTALLADLGAEVIKLEPPQGDDYRHIGPFVQGESALFTLMNRGKESIVLDLKDPASFFAAQDFPMRHKDVVYVSNAPAAELQKFLNIVGSVAGPVLTLRAVTNP